jgi:ABC-type branched-subunit amino acid transport system substrate-binding protein
MYKIIRWFLFKLNPESAHHFTFNSLKILFKFPKADLLCRVLFSSNNPRLEVEVFGLHFKNRVGLAAGFDKDGHHYHAMAALGYDSAQLLADAMRRAGSAAPAQVRDALAATRDFDGVTGRMTLDASRNARKSAVILAIQKGEFVYKETVNP